MKKAYLFPGQGSQFVGMGKLHYERNGGFKKKIDEASEILDFDLKQVLFEGPEATLKQTEFTQPAIFAHSYALFETLDASPDMVAGHSLGEFTALAASGALSFEDALLTVRERGKLMQKAGEDNPGAMAALIGMGDEQVEEICKNATEKTQKEVIPANYNCPGQLVISGYEEAVDHAADQAREEGCKLVKKLPVSGAFHSSLMQSAYDGLKDRISKIKIDKPASPVYSNYTGRPTSDPDEIRENILNQLLNPVQWTQTMINMNEDGATEFIEVGPGKVLQGLVKRTLNEVKISGHQ